MSHWLIAHMNGGMYAGKQVLPPDVLKATLAPAIALPNVQGEARGFWELLNQVYGMAAGPPPTAATRSPTTAAISTASTRRSRTCRRITSA